LPKRKSVGLAGRLGTPALIAGMTLALIGGALAAEVFLGPSASPMSGSGTLVGGSTITTTSTSSSEGADTTLNSRSQTTSPASTSTSGTPTSASSTSTSSRSSTTTASTSTQPGTFQIIIPQDVGNNESLNFQPSSVRVVIGVNNTIVWNDTDYVQHTVKSVIVPSGAKPWDSGILNQGQTYTLVLTVPGNYKYDCSIHPGWMIGTIQAVQG
jgi:plastocyanin